TIDPATGALAAIPGSPFAAAANPYAVAVDPTGRFAYVTNRGSNNISAFIIDPVTGGLAAIPGSPFAAGANPLSISVVAGQTDKVAPTTMATASPQSNSSGWNRTDVTVNLAATDNPSGSGVRQIQFAVSGAQNTGVQTEAGNAASVTISAEGTTTLSYFATDNAGNQESAKTLAVRIDKTPPLISGLPGPDCVIWPPNHKLVPVARVVAGDALSGILPNSLTLNGTSNHSNGRIVITGGPNEFDVQVGADKGLIYTLTATATDLAGNTTTSRATCFVPHDQGHR
ncbi:MAG TPA: beta-propeller fold lactonase family protein, partial [Rudaea sp.]|nr:beta-propeller fold lactonase family protein [Rudaea sp.]